MRGKDTVVSGRGFGWGDLSSHAHCGHMRETSGGFSLRPQPLSKVLQVHLGPNASDVTLPLEKPVGSRSLEESGKYQDEEDEEQGDGRNG